MKFLFAADWLVDNQALVRGRLHETQFVLTASCGLRLYETLKLNIGDVDLRRGVLTILRTKFARSRQVPRVVSGTQRSSKSTSRSMMGSREPAATRRNTASSMARRLSR